MGSISLQWSTISGVYLRIPEFWFYWWLPLLEYVTVFYTKDVAGLVKTTYTIGCCGMISIQPWFKVMKYSLIWLTWDIKVGYQYLPSINIWDNGPWKVLHIPLFLSSLPFGISFKYFCLAFVTFNEYLSYGAECNMANVLRVSHNLWLI